MLVKIFLLSLALSPMIFSFEIENFLSTGNFESIEPRGVFRRSPCERAGARPFEPNPRGCSWFWECKDENNNTLTPPREGKCPYDLHFQINPPACVYPIDMVTPCYYDDENIEAIPEKCVDYDPMQLLPHQLDCNKFRLCWKNTESIHDCPTGFHFSYFDNECVEPFLADCRAADNYCRSFSSLSNRHPYKCDSYHVCYECGGRKDFIELTCGNGYEYDNADHHCKDAASVTCTVPTISPTPGGLPQLLSTECPSLAFTTIAHPDVTNFYFYCVNGRSSLEQCPGSTNFNATIKGCD